jgi:hypothetical protein
MKRLGGQGGQGGQAGQAGGFVQNVGKKSPLSPQSPITNPQSPVKKPSRKRVGVSGKTAMQVNKQPPLKKLWSSGYLGTLGALTALIAAGGVIVGGIWLAILLMIDPNTVVWLNQFLPQWTRIPITVISPPQTLAAIQNEIRKSGLISGEPIYLDNSELLLPVLTSALNCQTDCEQIVELRVYQPAEVRGEQGFYELVTQFPITGPEEYFVFSTPVSTKSDDAESSHPLPLTKLTRFEDKAPSMGIWFNLSGQRLSGDTPMTYGQVIHYNPDQMHLSVMLQWTTPNEQSPYWQQVTGSPTPELVVNQTVGLEPQFKVHQIQPRNFVPNPIFLEEISLARPAIDTQTFRNALMLARNGLWSWAVKWLQSQKKEKWTTAAQAQMDVLQLHAQFTQSQAKQAWATPSSSIYANLIDGRWADALRIFQASDAAPLQEIATLLNTDSGRLWARVEAAIKVSPDDEDVKAWGALILLAQQGNQKAIAWLKQVSSSQTLDSTEGIPIISERIYELLDRLDTALTALSLSSRHLSQIVGTAQLVTTVNLSDWLQSEDRDGGEGEQGSKGAREQLLPESGTKQQSNQLLIETFPNLQIDPYQALYQVQVAAFNDGRRWRQKPFSNLQLPTVNFRAQLWKYLGLDTDPRILITVWTADGYQQSTIATVKAASFRGGVLQLLAAGEALPGAIPATGAPQKSRMLAYTDAALRWLEPSSITLSDLNKVEPKWTSAILPALWRELLKSGKDLTAPRFANTNRATKSGAIPSEAEMLAQMGQWSVRPIDLTGNNKPDMVVTLYEDLSGALKKPEVEKPVQGSQQYKPRTMIFSDTGALLYSEFSKDASTTLTAIADLGDGGPAALVINDPNTYSLKRWSPQRKRFD